MYTDTEYEELKNKIRNVLAEVYKTYHEFKYTTLYYKEKGKELNQINFDVDDDDDDDDDRDSSEILFVLLETLRSLPPNLEYALYIEDVYSSISPSEECINVKYYGFAVYQFIDRVSLFGISDTDVLFNNTFNRKTFFNESLVDIVKDPLDQLILYRSIISNKFENVFLCSPIYQIEPYNPDPSSIFRGKRGIVTYCITLSDYIVMLATAAYKKYVYDIDELLKRALNEKIYANKKLDRLYKKNRVEACNVTRIFSLISDYVKEAEKLMKQYGIVRVTFPLD